MLRFSCLWLLATALWPVSSAWSQTVLEHAAWLGMSRDQLAPLLVDANAVRSPRRLSSGALGTLRVPDVLCEGQHFEQTLFFAQQKLAQIEWVLLNPGAGPDAETAMLQTQQALLQSLREKLGPELAGFAVAPGSVADSASWVSAGADVMLFRSGKANHPSLRMVMKPRQLVDASEL
ncbi:hypothetical protein SAMN05216344_11110 [Polaromonas sp. OV174]|uniref:hypothetical protein n=1 Tax=Polaromonas sp. OV174 TaxID=1855300 RepID=UPI0008E285A6|nr:hypothetical protein [Polaromonas sp. OV174]SFC19562.1 hypothetical protein SAMN05216344_11110 [Polaromonas sp. OV174]